MTSWKKRTDAFRSRFVVLIEERERNATRSNRKVYLVGGGIASPAAAAFFVRDGGILGRNITIFEELDRLGGSLDGSGSPEDGYVVRGGRMMESKYLCTYDLFSTIPTLDRSKTVTQEIFEWNEVIKTSPMPDLCAMDNPSTLRSLASARLTF
jgi:oleate hydratase